MKNSPLLNSTTIAAIASCIVVFHCSSADVEKAPAADPSVPKSIFVASKDPNVARDPFYPNSTRLSYKPAEPKVVAPPVVKVSLVLNGLSGVAGHRLAMINGRTMASGETSDVPVDGGVVRVHCVEIRENSAVVEVNGLRQELSMHDEK
jgi:hypothetical protein